MSKHYTHWEHYFTQWCLHWLPSFGLQAEGKPQFSQLPLEADVLIIRKNKSGKWRKHPLFQYLSEYTLFEFKSVHDSFKLHHWGKLMAYVGLTMELKKLPAEAEVGAWLIVPYINKSLSTMLNKHQITLNSPVSGVHTGHTGLFPLVIVEYNHLPLEPAYYELKTFMKQGSQLKTSMLEVLRSLMGSKLLEEYNLS